MLLTREATNSPKHLAPGDSRVERGFTGSECVCVRMCVRVCACACACVGRGHSEQSDNVVFGSAQRKRCHRSFTEPVLYTLRRKGEGIGSGLSTATEDSLWKMPRLPIQDSDVITVEHAFPHAVSCAARPLCVCLVPCMCVCVVGGEMNTYSCLLHAASPSGRPQLYHWDVAS